MYAVLSSTKARNATKTSRDYADILRTLSDVVFVRFRGKADMSAFLAPTASVANDPKRTLADSKRCSAAASAVTSRHRALSFDYFVSTQQT
jgi:hypothetical protein